MNYTTVSMVNVFGAFRVGGESIRLFLEVLTVLVLRVSLSCASPILGLSILFIMV